MFRVGQHLFSVQFLITLFCASSSSCRRDDGKHVYNVCLVLGFIRATDNSPPTFMIFRIIFVLFSLAELRLFNYLSNVLCWWMLVVDTANHIVRLRCAACNVNISCNRLIEKVIIEWPFILYSTNKIAKYAPHFHYIMDEKNGHIVHDHDKRSRAFAKLVYTYRMIDVAGYSNFDSVDHWSPIVQMALFVYAVTMCLRYFDTSHIFRMLIIEIESSAQRNGWTNWHFSHILRQTIARPSAETNNAEYHQWK